MKEVGVAGVVPRGCTGGFGGGLGVGWMTLWLFVVVGGGLGLAVALPFARGAWPGPWVLRCALGGLRGVGAGGGVEAAGARAGRRVTTLPITRNAPRAGPGRRSPGRQAGGGPR
uniref:Uncharacterized protein n=1 Tax=Peronospora matthiolae TaxID=2874970 RepID=A0AAV1TYM5_9STRA